MAFAAVRIEELGEYVRVGGQAFLHGKVFDDKEGNALNWLRARLTWKVVSVTGKDVRFADMGHGAIKGVYHTPSNQDEILVSAVVVWF